MRSWIIGLVITAAFGVLIFTLFGERIAQLDQGEAMRLVYLLALMVLLMGGAFGLSQRGRRQSGEGPGVLVSLLVWGGLIALIAILYKASIFWAALLSLFGI